MYTDILKQLHDDVSELLVNITLESGVMYPAAGILLEKDSKLLIDSCDERPIILDKSKIESVEVCLKNDFEETEKDAEIMHQ